MSATQEHAAGDGRLPVVLHIQAPLFHACLVPPYDRLLAPIPKAAAAVPSMMTLKERQFLYHLAREIYVGEGVILDAGIFLGASTRCFGEGLGENARRDAILQRWTRPIVSCEKALTNRTMIRRFARHGIDIAVGESFASLIEKNIVPIRNVVDLRIGNIKSAGRVNSPIEILFLDVLKGVQISEFAVRAYFPRLIPNQSLVVQQDYLSEDLHFIRVHQEFFNLKFAYLGEIGSTAIFQCRSAITPQEIDRLFQPALSMEEQLFLLGLAEQRSIDPMRRLLVSLGRVRIAFESGDLECARKQMAAIECIYAHQIAQDKFARVQNAVRGARYLCETADSSATLREAQLISTGHR